MNKKQAEDYRMLILKERVDFLLWQYELIQSKKCKLSASNREKIVIMYNLMVGQGIITPKKDKDGSKDI